MEDLTNKVTLSKLRADEFIQPMAEIQKVITESGKTLTNADVNQLYKSIGATVATKALALAMELVDGKKVFITSPDGGEFTMRTGAAIGTYNDNGGAFTGTQFTNGDGSSGIERDYFGDVNPLWFGAVGDNVTDDTTSIQLALNASNGQTLKFTKGVHLVTAQLIIRDVGMRIVMNQGCLIRSTVAAGVYAIDIINSEYSDFEIRLESTGNGVNLRQDSATGSGNSYNNIIRGRIKGTPGRAAVKPSAGNGNVGINLAPPIPGKTNYFNKLMDLEVIRWDRCYMLEVDANANYIINPLCADYWYAYTIYSSENEMSGGFVTNSSGTASYDSEVLRLGDGVNASTRNNLMVSGEPGTFFQVYNISANVFDNVITLTCSTGSVTSANGSIDRNIIIDGLAESITTPSLVIRDFYSAPAQPAFMGRMGPDQSNIAIASTVTVMFDNEFFDQDLSFNTTTYTHTAKVSGNYQYTTILRLGNVDSAGTFYNVIIKTSNREYSHIETVDKYSGDLQFLTINLSMLADMDVNDTAFITILQNSGTAQTDVLAIASFFAGFMAN